MWGNLDCTDGVLARSPYHEFDELIPVLKDLGYDGIEIPLKVLLYIGYEKVISMLKDHGLKCTVMVFTDNVVCPGEGVLWGGPYETMKPDGTLSGELYTKPCAGGEQDRQTLVETHLQVWKECVEQTYILKRVHGLPLTLMVSHTLKDYFTSEMAEQFFSEALKFEEANGYFVCHETHRKRFLHSPWVARDFVPKFPNMKICADLSHWINVAETDCQDADLNSVIRQIAPQVHHVHCRVGYDHGPQVADPRAPEWLPYMEGHEKWWDLIWSCQLAREMETGVEVISTMIAEHGPPNYQQTMPYSREPLAHIWDINHWIHLRRQARFQKLIVERERHHPGVGSHSTSNVIPSKTQGYNPVTSL